MKIANPHYLYFLWINVGLIIFYIISFKKKRAILKKFVEERLWPQMFSTCDWGKQKLKAILLILVSILMVVALLRPQWGYHWQEVKRKGLDIIMAIDTSKSMLAQDIKPNRLERAKLAVSDLVKKLKGDRIGLIAFSGKAFLQCPLTLDYNGFLITLKALDVNTIPVGGTSISSAIREAIKSYEGGMKKYKVLILITDGEDHQGGVMEAAQEAKKEGIKIFCIGIGTKEGELIPIVNEEGQREFLKDRDGNVVKTRLDEATLQKIALTTGGSYVHATVAEFGLDLIYEKKLSQMEKREFQSKRVKHYEERYQIPLFLAWLILLIEPLLKEEKIR